MIESKYKHLDGQVTEMYVSGKSMADVAVALQLAKSTVSYRVKCLGLSRSISECLAGRLKSGNHKKHLSESRIEKGVAKGSKNPNWRGGITAEVDGIRHSKSYDLWRLSVLERDGYVCQICSEYGNHAHHVFPFSKYAHLRFVVSNGKTLCKDCHESLHNGAEFTCRELLEPLTVNDEGNQQPSLLKEEGSETMYCTRKG